MNCKDCCQDCQRIGCDIELECSGYVEPSNGTKERMDERLEMMHKLYPDAKSTNADQIRSMTDEELAKFISGKARGFGEEYEGYMSALDWLQKPIEDK